MLNLSDTHASLADLQDLAHPKQQAIIEIAPYYSEIYRFGDYLVEHVQPKASTYQEPHEFRVRGTKDGLSAAPLASFAVGQVQRVVKQGSNLVIMGTPTGSYTDGGVYVTQTAALVYDLSNPAAPRKAAQIALPSSVQPYYYYYCGWAPWTAYYWNASNNWTTTAQGLVTLSQTWSYTSSSSYRVTLELVGLDLSSPDQPQVWRQPAGSWDSASYYSGGSTLVADGADPSSFYLTYRTTVGQVTRDGKVFTQYRYYAQRWQFATAGLVPAEAINLPGPLINTWSGADGQRMFLTRDQIYTQTTSSSGAISYTTDARLALLGQVSVDGAPAAQLLDAKTLAGVTPSALAREGSKLIVTAQPYTYYSSSSSTTSWEQTSDRLMVFDLSANRLDVAYDQPTKAYYLRIMGTQKDRAFLNLQGDGIVVVDVSKPAAPIGVTFLRTLGYATHLESFGDDVYVASGYFGVDHLSLRDPPNL
jgi:hypothetical protein